MNCQAMPLSLSIADQGVKEHEGCEMCGACTSQLAVFPGAFPSICGKHRQCIIIEEWLFVWSEVIHMLCKDSLRMRDMCTLA